MEFLHLSRLALDRSARKSFRRESIRSASCRADGGRDRLQIRATNRAIIKNFQLCPREISKRDERVSKLTNSTNETNDQSIRRHKLTRRQDRLGRLLVHLGSPRARKLKLGRQSGCERLTSLLGQRDCLQVSEPSACAASLARSDTCSRIVGPQFARIEFAANVEKRSLYLITGQVNESG